ncbi:MAG TPA: protein-L-isoaspartate(D-aspartate) O-methyltransferase [Syntrophorhabdaceae bacterium]|nr:protein-L-isoaspartate(D-aspartate) O-methyltransferase [Syntrophorhabdaceae bacterium]HOL04679.1 protein-L-isoaspartate(D-aspartate) O-methyltransferase [Syntrophorhabdaceae bacterium]HON85183.1 protein-L-isoaspartate(D-aspartate) O-methyltransferase [Syntrophorhabdaceae bacterium]HOT42630.1 protein-L-isoaspartate(D-aspartate) O-methyltransferase [Syntrophorhabdaceae bacterium]HPC66114.1 protein-L-isoaspartate(D-aspartate) O-methyltransferase [Syntrophorhabdaceae bacterium]
MAIDEFFGKRQQMVDTQLIKRGITDPRVLQAMRKVPRHLFIDSALWSQAYEDHPLPIGEKQTISQPYIVALMTEALRLQGHEKVLEIGAGSGYQTAILAELAEQVYSIERLPAIAKNARKILDKLQYRNVVITVSDGTTGWREYSPFDAIIVTAAAPHIPQPLFEQLKIGGRLVIPIGGEFSQDLMVYTKTGESSSEVENLGGCRFVKLIGSQGWKE